MKCKVCGNEKIFYKKASHVVVGKYRFNGRTEIPEDNANNDFSYVVRLSKRIYCDICDYKLNKKDLN